MLGKRVFLGTLLNMESAGSTLEKFWRLLPSDYSALVPGYIGAAPTYGEEAISKKRVAHESATCAAVKTSLLETLLNPWDIDPEVSWCTTCWGAKKQGSDKIYITRLIRVWLNRVLDTFATFRKSVSEAGDVKELCRAASEFSETWSAVSGILETGENCFDEYFVDAAKKLYQDFLTLRDVYQSPHVKTLIADLISRPSLLNEVVSIDDTGKTNASYLVAKHRFQQTEQFSGNGFILRDTEVEATLGSMLGVEYKHFSKLAVWTYGSRYNDVWIGVLPQEVRPFCALRPTNLFYEGGLSVSVLEAACTFYTDGLTAEDSVRTARSLDQ